MKTMSFNRRVLFVATSPLGGAGIAAKNIFEALRLQGVDIRFLVLDDPSGAIEAWDEPRGLRVAQGRTRFFWKLVQLQRHVGRTFVSWVRTKLKDRFFRGAPLDFDLVTVQKGTASVDTHPLFDWADIIHLHWTAGFLADRQAWSKKQWVVSLHDCFPFTGGCHFPNQCRQFESSCQSCPQLKGTRNARVTLRRQKEKFQGLSSATAKNVVIHAPSRWIGTMAARSQLLGRFSSVTLPYFYKDSVFRPLDQAHCRELLGLPSGKKLALFVAANITNVRKGLPWFQRLAVELAERGWEFILVGDGGVSSQPGVWPLGSVTDLRIMAAAYNAADLFVTTALQDNLPSTVVESQLCGTPVLGFAVGGHPEMVEHKHTGYLSSEISVQGLVAGVDWFEREAPSRALVRAWADENWNREDVSRRWIEFYKGLG